MLPLKSNLYLSRNKKFNDSNVEEFKLQKFKDWRKSKKNIFLCLVFAVLLSIFVFGLWLMKLNRDELHEFLTPALLVRKKPIKDCNSCKTLKVKDGREYVRFEKSKSQVDGCTQLKVTCGLDKGTEAIIQWYRDGKDFGVSFMNQEGQSKIERILKCTDNGEYEFEENGAIEVINEIECIVALKHEEL